MRNWNAQNPRATFFVLIAFCFCLLGCNDEGLRFNDVVLNEPIDSLFEVGSVPLDIQSIIWGKDIDTLMAELDDTMEGESNPDDIWAKHLIHKICLRREQEAYYQKYISAGGVAIMGDKLIPDRFFFVARDIVFSMTQKHPELRELLTPSRENRSGATQHPFLHDVTGRTTPSPKFRMILSNGNLGNAVIPEMRLEGGINYRVLTFGGYVPQLAWVTASAYDEITLIFVSVFVHEFAHAINLAIRLLDMTFDDRLDAAYAAAKENGSYFGGVGSTNHAMRNPYEYWAESAQRWFTVFSLEGQEFLHDEFRRRDPLMYDLLAEWFDLINLRSVLEVYQ